MMRDFAKKDSEGVQAGSAVVGGVSNGRSRGLPDCQCSNT